MIRKAIYADLDAAENIYDKLHLAEEDGFMTERWIQTSEI